MQSGGPLPFSAQRGLHKVSSAAATVSVSIHIYAAIIGHHPRHVYPEAGGMKPFISGYANGPDTPVFGG